MITLIYIGVKEKMRNSKSWLKKSVVMSIIATLFICMIGCSNVAEEAKNTKIIVSMGFANDEVFRLDTRSCLKPEILVYLACLQLQYEDVFGSDIWSKKGENGTTVSMDGGVKENVLARISQIKAMNLLATNRGITLSTEETTLAKNASSQFYEVLTADQIEYLGITEEILDTMFEEYALANKLYENLIKDINPEISDDEARTITVEHVFLRTYSLNGLGEKIDLTQEQKQKKLEIAENIMEQINEGKSFDSLIDEYNEDEVPIRSFGKGEMEPDYEVATFALATGEISDIIETKDGYYIFRCLSSFNKEETQENKINIVKERKKDVFEEEYTSFVKDLPESFNKEVWDTIQIIPSKYLPVTTFFAVYNQYFN